MHTKLYARLEIIHLRNLAKEGDVLRHLLRFP